MTNDKAQGCSFARIIRSGSNSIRGSFPPLPLPLSTFLVFYSLTEGGQMNYRPVRWCGLWRTMKWTMMVIQQRHRNIKRINERLDDTRMSWSDPSFSYLLTCLPTSMVVYVATCPFCWTLWFIQIRILYWIIIIKILMIKVGLWFIYAMQWIIIPRQHRSSVLPNRPSLDYWN